jgi:uncharacterized protein YjbI with pentapeptide repeats
MKKPLINKNKLEVEIVGSSGTVDIEQKSIKGQDFSERKLDELRADSCWFEDVVVSQSEILEGKVTDCVFNKCNFAGATLHDFFFERTEFASSWMQGVEIAGAPFQNCYFKSCKLNAANFRYGTFKHCVFDSCILQESDFMGVNFKKVDFVDCDLRESQFSQTKLEKVSFKGSLIDGMRLNKQSLEEVTVDTAQAIYLASTFGLTIED